MFVTEFSQVQKLYNLKSYALQLNIQQKKSNGYKFYNFFNFSNFSKL